MGRTIGVAIAVPDPWGRELDRQRRSAGDPNATLVPPHVTLLPPTTVDDADLGVVHRHLADAAARHRPFELHLRGTGTFRPVTAVVFVAVARGISECELLQSDVRHGPLARELRFPYHPHVTVAHDVPDAQLDAIFDRLSAFEARFRVDGFTLFEHGDDGRWRPRRRFSFPQPGARGGPADPAAPPRGAAGVTADGPADGAAAAG